VWECSHKGNELSPETIAIIEEILPLEEFNEAYSEAHVNFSAFSNGYIGLNTKVLFKAYLECARKYPVDIIIARMRKTYSIWAVFPHEKYILDTNYEQVIRDFTDIGGEEWHYIDKFEPMRHLFKALYIYPNELSKVYFSLASCGVCIVIWLLLLYVSIIENNKKIMCVVYPIAVNTVALFIGCCFQDCCYTYPMVALTIPFVYIFFLYMCKEKRSAVQSDITIL